MHDDIEKGGGVASDVNQKIDLTRSTVYHFVSSRYVICYSTFCTADDQVRVVTKLYILIALQPSRITESPYIADVSKTSVVRM
jgi:hypothetical protein